MPCQTSLCENFCWVYQKGLIITDTIFHADLLSMMKVLALTLHWFNRMMKF